MSILSQYGLNSISDLKHSQGGMGGRFSNNQNMLLKTINSGIFLQGGFLEVTVFKGKLYARKDAFYSNLENHFCTVQYEGRKYQQKIESYFERIGRGNTLQASIESINPLMIPILNTNGELKFLYKLSESVYDVIGEGSIAMSTICQQFRTKKWLPVYNHNSEKTGEILFEARYLPPQQQDAVSHLFP